MQQVSSWWNTFKEKMCNDQSVSARRKFYNTLWAIFFSFIIISIIFLISGNNPINVIVDIFNAGLGYNGNKTITYLGAYAFAALAIAVCFKAGIFNIGISGQMMMAGFTTLLIFRSELLTKTIISSGSIVLAFVIAIFAGMFVSILAGVLKAYLGINEVVSTIMINWIVFYTIKSLVVEFAEWHGKVFLQDNNAATNNSSIGYLSELPAFFFSTTGDWYSNKWNWLIISMVLIFAISIWFILSKTTFGYKIKMVGLNRDASEYSGTNRKNLVLIAFAISGAFAGIAGFVWYIGLGGVIEIKDQPLNAGFDSIAISLLVFNNPIGIIFSSLLYGWISAGTEYIANDYAGMPVEINQVIIGILVYSAAITFIFTKLNIIDWIKRFLIFSQYNRYHSQKLKYLKTLLTYPFVRLKAQINVIKLNCKQRKYWKNIKKQHKNQILRLENGFKEVHQLKRFDVSKLNEMEQMKYFDTLAEYKKETDNLLAEKNYFEKIIIISEVKNKLKKVKSEMKTLKEFILENHQEKTIKINQRKIIYKNDKNVLRDNYKEKIEKLSDKKISNYHDEIKKIKVDYQKLMKSLRTKYEYDVTKIREGRSQ